MFQVVQVIIGISFLIFVHELGHYICARLAGIRVNVFSLGFGPRLCGFMRGPTDYRLSLLPLGGYVQVAGEDPTERSRHQPDGLQSQGMLVRTFFFSGGVVMNLLFALIAFPIVFSGGVEFPAPVLGNVFKGSPAWEAGLEPGDRILKVNGKVMYSFDNMQVEVALAGRKRKVLLEIERGGQVIQRAVIPRYQNVRGLQLMGVTPAIQEGSFPLEVNPEGPAYKAGVRSGDLLLAINDTKANRAADVQEAIEFWREEPDREVRLQVTRQGERREFRYSPALPKGPRALIGVRRASRRVVGLRDQVPTLQRLGLERGDHILYVDGVLFHGDGLDLSGAGDSLQLTVKRKGVEKHLVLETRLTKTERQQLGESIALGQDKIGLYVVPTPNSPAMKAGMQAGDMIQFIDGVRISTWEELENAVQKAHQKELAFLVLGSTGLRPIKAAPVFPDVADLGFATQLQTVKNLYQVEGPAASIKAGFVCSFDLIKQLYVTLKRLVTGEVAASNLGGIITISRVSYHFAKEGWARLFYFLALLSINLAFINVLPIPVLDGGHLMFILIERIKGSPVSAKVHTYSQILGLVFVLALMVFVTYNDIRKLF